MAWWIYFLWSSTWRFSVKWEDPSVAEKSLIFAHWHRDEICVLPFAGKFKIATMTSTSNDGQLIDHVIRRFGGITTKGSSTRGAARALKGLVRLVKGGRNCSMAVDGPRGPIYQVKPGIFTLAKLTGATIIPLGVASDRHFVFEKSWNKSRLPKPFSRVVVYAAKPLDLNFDEVKDPSNRERLANAIANACNEASKLTPL